MSRRHAHSVTALASYIYFTGRCGDYPYPPSFFTVSFIRNRIYQYCRIARISVHDEVAFCDHTDTIITYVLRACNEAFRHPKMIEKLPSEPLQRLFNDFIGYPLYGRTLTDFKDLQILAYVYEKYQTCESLLEQYICLRSFIKRCDLPESSQVFNAVLMAMIATPIDEHTLDRAIEHLHTVVDDDTIILAVH